MRLVISENGQYQSSSKELRVNGTAHSESFPSCIHELLEPAAEQYSYKTALICGDTSLTYGELTSLSNGLAKVFIQRGIGHGDLVGVALDRSVQLVAVMLAVMKTGAAYVPIEPALPAERIAQMMDDASPRLLISSDSSILEEFASRSSIQCLSLAEAQETIRSNIFSNDNPRVKVKGNDLVYVMYTSGSTGRPKGVEVTHSSVCNLLLSMQKEPGCRNNDRLLAITTVSFDMAVVELFLPLLCGATTVIARREEVRDMTALVSLMERHQITIMQGTPAIWQMLLDSGWSGQPRLDKIFCGGEALSRALADRLLDCSDELWNCYGPTEATVYASIWQVLHEGEILIGGSISNGQLYVLDEKLSPVPYGELGELCIGGEGVARGYRNNTELSRTKFVGNPFHKGLMYRTGDVARFVTPRMVSVLGRADGQVKIRGHRIEPGDIEAALTAREDISAAVVVCRDDRLVAYYVRRTSSNSAEVQSPLDRASIRSWLAERLPDYMVPAFFVEMEAFPVTMNGKIDRKALPDPITAIKAQESRLSRATMASSELEDRLVEIWSKVLGHDQINVHDNFFDIGGDSARVVRVQKELQDLLSRRIPTPKLFEHFTIKALAASLTSSQVPGITGLPDHPPQIGEISSQEIAIVSMACRLPGDLATPEAFWELLESGGDAITEVPVDRWGSNSQDRSFCKRGGFLPSIYSYDISLFGISPREARRLDPSQYMMLETCWEGFERAGYTMEQLRDSSTGIFIGTSNILSHQSLNPTAIRDLENLDGYTVTGSAAGTMSGRISYQFGLQGPTMTIDTACSSSLVTTHLACNALRLGECNMAVSGGISLMPNHGLHAEFDKLQGMSPDGRCRTFSADTEGTGWSEGCVMVVLKRLVDAQRDGDQIHAVIRGSAVNHDGRSASLTTPSGPAQQRLLRSALASARLQPQDVDYVEAHGTGTKLGDPIEGAALAEVFGPSRAHHDPLYIGSAKSNIGHTQAAAGLVGLVKVVLAMKHDMLPQTLHVTKPTPAIDWQGANMTPVLSNRKWSSTPKRPRRAGISAFGIGGTNAHVIIQEPPKPPLIDVKPKGQLLSKIPFLLSGDTDAALRTQAEELQRHLTFDLGDSIDIAYSLATTRTHLRRRMILMASNKNHLLQELKSFLDPDSLVPPPPHNTDPAKIAMLFTGQGSQWLSMGKNLSEFHPIFRDAITEITDIFTPELEVPLLDVMWADPESATAKLLDRTDFAQPALFALEVALYRLWKAWGVSPDFLLGHSLGELVAAHVAGILDLPDACRLVAARGRLMQAQSGEYGMAAVEASSAEVAAMIEHLGHAENVEIALYNSPSQTVISGRIEAIKVLTAHFAEQGFKAKMIVNGHAFHSRFMDGMLADYQAVAEKIHFHPPQISIVSSLDGKVVDKDRMTQAQYWVKQVREPVRFTDGIQTLANRGINTFLELGPEQVLCGMGAACLADDDTSSISWLPSLAGHKECELVLQASVTQLHLLNVHIDWQAYFKPHGCKRVQLPTYAFQRNYRLLEDPVMQRSNSLHNLVNGAGPSNKNDNRARRHEGHFEFDISWHTINTKNAKPRGTWGLMVTRSDTIWATSVTAALSEADIQLVQIDDLIQAEEMEGLICLWDSDNDPLSQTQDLAATALSQLQTAAQAQFTPPIIWITRHAIGTGNGSDDQGMRLGAGPLLWGLMRTASNEYPELNLRLIDLSEDAASPSILSALAVKTEPECVVRQDRLLVPRMQHVKSFSRPPSVRPLIRTDGAVLVTGGLGYLGARIAQWLVKDHNVRDLVLTSRRGLSNAGAEALVKDLSEIGVKVTVIACDVSTAEGVRSIIEAISTDRPLRAVVHAAGVVDSGILPSMTPQRFETTLGPKAYGAWHLHQETRHMDLDVFLMISSISGVMGMQGLANYAAANSFLDALAHLRCSQGLPGTSVACGTLAGDGGMAAKLKQSTRSHLSQFGLDPITLEKGLEAFEKAILDKHALTVVAELDLKRLQCYVEEQSIGMPPLLSSLLNQGTTSSNPSMAKKSLLEMLVESELGQRPDLVLKMVRQVIAKALGFAHAHDVEVDRPMKDIGIDSLTAVQIRNKLAALTGLKLSVNIALMHPNLRGLSQSLLAQMEQTSTSFTTGVSTMQLNMTAIRKGCLDSSFKFGSDKSTQSRSSQLTHRPKSVFLTGATGFVGIFVLHELLKRGITSYCLVRANNCDEARQRLESTLQDHSLWDPCLTPLIQPVVGDMSRPLFGLTEQAFDDLASKVDSICHSGALVDWMRPLEDYIGPNIVSAHEVLRLASRGRSKPVHLVSTISTLPKHMGLDLNEDDLEYGYGTSKYLAERMMAAARWRGASTFVYRLPYVTASSTTGHFRHDRGDFLHNLIVGCLEMGAFPKLEADLSAVLPVDYLSQSIVTLMTGEILRDGQEFDFLNARPLSCTEYFKLIGTLHGGEEYELKPFGAWKKQVLGHTASYPKSSLARISAVLESFTDENASLMFKGLPIGEHVFGGDEYPAPVINEGFVRRYLDRMNEQAGN